MFFRRFSLVWVVTILVMVSFLPHFTMSAGGTPAKQNLVAGAKKIATEQLKKFGDKYTSKIDPTRHMVYISALDEDHLNETIKLLEAYSDAQRRTLLTSKPAWNITIILPTVDDYTPLAPGKNIIGFYSPAGRRLTSIDKGRVLIHEFTHALHHADMAAVKQVHPPWVSEGLATLFESSTITPSGLASCVDMRLAVLKKAIGEKKMIPLDDLLDMGQDRFMQDSKLAYSQSRYLMLYLHQKGRLKQWYTRYKKDFSRDPSGKKTLEWALGSKLEKFQTRWHKWLGELKLPAATSKSGSGRLGLEFKNDRRGAKVIALKKDGAAEVAGRIKVGDIITEFNGVEITTAVQLASAIRSAGADRTVNVKLIRRGRSKTVLQPLGSPKKD